MKICLYVRLVLDDTLCKKIYYGNLLIILYAAYLKTYVYFDMILYI